MQKPIVLICNTCPFRGEVFLQNELKWLPQGQTVSLYPIFASNKEEQVVTLNSSIEVRKITPDWRRVEKLKAGWNGLKMLFKTHECSMALNKSNSLRNLVKAFKFAYISELRVNRIVQQLHEKYNEHEELILYSYWLYEAAYIAARVKSAFQSSRFISRCHGFDLYEIRHPNGYLPFRNFIMETVDAVYPISEDGREYISKMYNGKWDGIVQTMRLGTDDWGVNPTSIDSVPTVVSCSNLVEVKRVDRIIEALKSVNHPIRWYHFGDGPLREQLEQKARELHSYIEYKFMGSVPNEVLMRFYQENHVDAFINASSSEGVPVSIMEALSFGIPAVATDVGGTHEIICDGENGYLIPAVFSNAMLCEAISRVLEPQNRDKLRKQARVTWERCCNASVNYEAFFRTITQ